MNLNRDIGARDLFIIGIVMIFVGYIVGNSISAMLAGFISIAALIVLLTSLIKGVIWITKKAR